MNASQRTRNAARWLRSGTHVLGVIAVGGLFAVLLSWRMSVVDTQFGGLTDCRGCFSKSVLYSDAWILAAICLLIFAAMHTRRWIVGTAIRVLIALVLLSYWLDIYLLKSFGTRLYLNDVATYGRDLPILARYLKGMLAAYAVPLTAQVAFVVLLSAFLFLQLGPLGRRLLGRTALLFSVPLVAMGFMPKVTYVHTWAYDNVVKNNLSGGEAVPYEKVRLETEAAVPPHCAAAGDARHKNVLLVIVESLSPYQSQFMSGLNDWTPNIDRLAKENLYFSRFHANSFATNNGLESLFTGLPSLPAVRPFTQQLPFEGYWGIARTLPKVARSHGYHTLFLTSGILDFARKGAWVSEIGFEHIEGHDVPDYAGLPRFQFDAVADEYLYQRALKVMDQNASRQPWLMAVETVTTHQPYIDPETGQRSLERSFRYADRVLGEFVRKLEQRKFFDSGVLLITSDHRSMTPVLPDEERKFGLATASRIPLIVVGDIGIDVPKRDDNLHQQADLLDSLDYLMSGSACSTDAPGNLFTGIPANCVYHSRGDMRNHVDVFCGDRAGTVALQGDETAMISGDLDDPGAAVHHINQLRLQALARQTRITTASR